MTDLELGYLAGLFDGEGSTTIQRRANNRVHVRIGSTDLDIVEKALSYTKMGAIGKPRRLPSGKQCWVWSVTDQEDCFFILGQMMPLLSKRRQIKAKEAISILEIKITNRRKSCWYCGAEFNTTTRPNAECCSKPCSDKHQYFKRTGTRVEPRIVVCLDCKNEFTTTQPSALCCSKLCDQRNRKVRGRVLFEQTTP